MITSLLIVQFVSLATPFVKHSIADDTKPIYISIVPFHSSEKILSLYQPMIDYLNQKTNYRWKLKLYRQHDQVINAICQGEISIVMLGPLLAASVYKNCGIQPILVTIGLEKKPTFRIAIITADTHIKTVHDLQGKTVGLFKVNTAAHGITKLMLLQEGVQLSSVKFIIYSKLEDIVRDVLLGQITAGGVRESMFTTYKDYPLRVLKLSKDCPSFSFFAAKGIDQKIIKDFQRALTVLNVNKNPKTLNITDKWDPEIANGFMLPYKGFVNDIINFYESIKDIDK